MSACAICAVSTRELVRSTANNQGVAERIDSPRDARGFVSVNASVLNTKTDNEHATICLIPCPSGLNRRVLVHLVRQTGKWNGLYLPVSNDNPLDRCTLSVYVVRFHEGYL